MATAAEVTNIVTEVSAAATAILGTLETVDPAVALPASIVEEILALGTKAVAAWSTAAGTPITVAAVQALLVNPVPLTAPTS